MSAGESARAKAAELRAKAARLAGYADNWEAGAVGEERVGAVLDAEPSFKVLHDRLLKPANSLANLDHIVVTSAGVFLIDAKNWTGNVTVHNDSLWQHWTNADGRQSAVKDNELGSVRRAAAEMEALTGVRVTPVLCLAGESRFDESTVVNGVAVVRFDALVAWLAAQPPARRPVDVHSLAVRLSAQFPPAVGGALSFPPPAPPPARRSHRPVSPRRPKSAGTLVTLPALAVFVLAVIAFGPRLAVWVSHRITAASASTQTTSRSTLSPARAVQLDDWRIRAGLYAAKAQPPTLRYTDDADLGSQSANCRIQQRRLQPLRHGLLNAPDRLLKRDAARYDRATAALLHACERNRPVALHHAEGAITAAASDANIRYARLLGEDPSSIYSKHVF